MTGEEPTMAGTDDGARGLIGVERRPGGRFTVTFKGLPILRHAPERPCVRLGRGEGRYRMRHGSFTIRERSPRPKPPGDAVEIRIEPDGAAASIELGPGLRLELAVVEGRLELRPEVPDGRGVNRTWIELVGFPGERIHGGGEQYSRLDLKGCRLPLWVEEQGIGRGRDLITFLLNVTAGAGGSWYTTYFPQPTFVSSAGYYCHVETGDYAVFDFTRDDRTTLYVWGVPERLVLDVADDVPRLLESLSAYLGRQPVLPGWASEGLWLGVQGGAGTVRAKLDVARRHGVRVGAVWAQDWVGRRETLFGRQVLWNWQYDRERYPELPAFIGELEAEGVRFLGYINSFLDPEGEHYREAAARGLLVRDRRGAIYKVRVTTFPVAMLDLTNPETCAWLKRVIRDNLLGVGLAGWMADFGEHLPTDAVLHSGEPAERYHNRYPVVWARLNHEAIAEAGQADRALFFTRAGHSGLSRYSPMVWAGDQLVNWSKDDGLPTVVPAALSLGYSGVGQFHHDIGGYTALAWIRRSKEIFLRWAELAAFNVVMRTHEGLRPSANWQFDSDEDTLRHLARMTSIHAALRPYLEHAVAEYQARGLPLWRHPALHYPGDVELARQRYQYLLGRDLLVAPVCEPRRVAWTAHLPRGDEWVHLWSGRGFPARGGPHEVPAPVGEPPVFYRRESAFAALFADLPGAGRSSSGST